MKILYYLKKLDLLIWELFFAAALTMLGLWRMDANVSHAVITMVCVTIITWTLHKEITALAIAEPDESGNPYPANKIPLMFYYPVLCVASIVAAICWLSFFREIPLIFLVGTFIPIICPIIKKNYLAEQQ